MNNQILSLQTGRISQISGRNVLKAGSSVYVKVIADKGNGQYLGSVAGNRVNITSGKNLQVGSSFVATIHSKDGVIYITPKDGASSPPARNVPLIETGALQQTQLSNLLASLGLPTTKLSGNLLKMMMQLEMKVDGDVLRQLYKLASKHKGREKAAGEIITLLKQKGLEPSSEEIEELLNYINEDFSDTDENNSKNNSKKKSKDLINKSNSIDKGWTLIPYNLIEIESEDKNVIGAGVIRILKDKSQNIKIINLNCFYDNKEFMFNINFSNKKINNIKFNINPSENTDDYYEEKLKSYFSDKQVSIEWAAPEFIEGNSCENVEIISVKGEV